MAGYADKVQKAVGDSLRPGESVVAAIRTQPRGAAVGMGVGGVIGVAVAHRKAAKARAAAGEGSIAGKWPASHLALALTEQRLLAFKYTGMGKPKDLQAEIGLDQVADIEPGNAKITKAVVVSFVDGSGIELECAKIEKVDDFLSAFRAVKGSG